MASIWLIHVNTIDIIWIIWIVCIINYGKIMAILNVNIIMVIVSFAVVFSDGWIGKV